MDILVGELIMSLKTWGDLLDLVQALDAFIGAGFLLRIEVVEKDGKRRLVLTKEEI